MTTEADNFRDLVKGSGLSRAQVAGLLYISINTVDDWRRPATNKNATQAPRWAVELLAYKTRQRIPPRAAPEAGDGGGEGLEPTATRARARARPGQAARAAAKD